MNQSKIVGAVEKIYQLLMINVCFFITTLPLMFAFVILKPTINALPFFFLASIPLGPTLFAASHCLAKIAREKEKQVFKVFFQYWRQNFKKSLTTTFLLVVVIVVGVVDLRFFSDYPMLSWLKPLVILLLSMALMVYSNLLFLQTKKDLRLKELIKLGIYYAFKQLFISLVNGLLLTTLILGMVLKPAVGFLIFPSILLGILFWNSQKLVGMNVD